MTGITERGKKGFIGKPKIPNETLKEFLVRIKKHIFRLVYHKKRKEMKNLKYIGNKINFRGLINSPINEQEVVVLFGLVAKDLGFLIERIRTNFPDCIARRYNGKEYKKVKIEFEFKSSNFILHGHSKTGCDVIVCWEDDLINFSLPIIELKDIIKDLENDHVKYIEDVFNERLDVFEDRMNIFEKKFKRYDKNVRKK